MSLFTSVVSQVSSLTPFLSSFLNSRNLDSVTQVLDALAEAAIKWEESGSNEVTHRAL